MTDRALRVVVVHNRYRSEQPSGEDRVVDQEVGLLAEAGHHVTRFERRSDEISSMPPARKATVPVRAVWNRPVRAELAEHLRRERADVVHIHNTVPLLSPSVVAACTDTGTPAVATLHNYTMVCAPGTLYRAGGICTDCLGTGGSAAVRHGCYRESPLATVPAVAGMVLRRRNWYAGVRRFFCISAAQRSMLIQAGMPARRLAVKHNFVPDPERYRDPRETTGEYVLYLGRMTEEKGVRLLMSAWDTLAERGGIGVPLVLAGAGPMTDELREWARDRADVRYLGFVDRGACAELLAGAVTVAVPSQWLEAFGLVVIEAMAAGVPAVAAGHGALPELVEEGRTGLLHRPDDADSLALCLRRAALPELSARMGRAARERYEREFSSSAGLRGLVSGYERAIAATDSCASV